EVFDLMWRYGARDYRNIGHKAIFVANAYRTLEAIGWQHSEPVLRSLALGLLDFGKQQSVNGYAFEDQCYAGNLKRVKESFARLPDGWVAEDGDAAATRGILDTLRAAKPEEACADVAARLVKGTANQGAVWNAVHLAAAELRMRTRSQAILGIHTVTSANGLHYGFQAAYDAQMRFLILLQAAGWMSQFRNYAQSREENLRSFPITNLEPSADDAPLDRALAEIFAGIPKSVDASASRILRLARDPAGRQAFIATALRHTIAKADEVHYYKYLAAMIEDVPLVSPEWQPHLVAGMAYYIKGSQDAEPAAMKRAREALKGLGA
ncbi:MAG: hypothetical protein HY235_08670, partial [Acidobacteria bacterium]|nr:hypothetical protein [Acidobacteriota bacterium]